MGNIFFHPKNPVLSPHDLESGQTYPSPTRPSSSRHTRPAGAYVSYPMTNWTHPSPLYQHEIDRSHMTCPTGGDLYPPQPLQRAHTHPPSKPYYNKYPVILGPEEGTMRVQIPYGHTLKMPGYSLTVEHRAARYGHGKPGSLAIPMAPLGEHDVQEISRCDVSMGAEESDRLRSDDDTPPRNGRIPSRGSRRYGRQPYKLRNGNLIIKHEAPSKLLDRCALNMDDEFKYMRYTAVTCDPDNFKFKGYTLRQDLYKPDRQTELLIGITVYDEDEQKFCQSMAGIMSNIRNLVSKEKSKTWGEEGWKKVVVCILIDGHGDVNMRTLSVLAAMGCYQEGVARKTVDHKPVIAHIYEYTTQASVTPVAEVKVPERPTPVQVILLLKEKNQSKINSHQWLFNAFAPILEPRVCILLDVGTMPGPTSIYHLWKGFNEDSNLGGACGTVRVKARRFGAKLLNPLVAAQNFEYKMDSILEKPLQSVTGYIGVLSGTFSAYRYVALKKDIYGNGPLETYFSSEKRYIAGADPFLANMGLAGDRILPWEILTRPGAAWTVQYIHAASADKEVPDNLTELIQQRRRWIVGWMFVVVYSIFRFKRVYQSHHTVARKLWLHVDLLYQAFNFIFSWFALGNYYIVFSILSKALEDPNFSIKGIDIVNNILGHLYLGLVVTCYVLALGNRPCPCKSKQGYTAVFIGFMSIAIYMVFAAGFLAYKGIKDLAAYRGEFTIAEVFSIPVFRNIIIEAAVTIVAYICASLLYLELGHLITSGIQYFLLSPSYTAVLTVYALANIHEAAWLSEPADKSSASSNPNTVRNSSRNHIHVDISTDEEDNDMYEGALQLLETRTPKEEPILTQDAQRDDYYRNVTTGVFLAWTLTNWVLGAAVTGSLVKEKEANASIIIDGYLGIIMASIAGLTTFRLCGSIAYRLMNLISGG